MTARVIPIVWVSGYSEATRLAKAQGYSRTSWQYLSRETLHKHHFPAGIRHYFVKNTMIREELALIEKKQGVRFLDITAESDKASGEGLGVFVSSMIYVTHEPSTLHITCKLDPNKWEVGD